MSTRSGKRIHTSLSLFEDSAMTEQEPAVKTEKKTRSKRVKENLDELSGSIFKNKKRNNYVSYPTDDELFRDTATKREGETKPSRTLRKNALKEHNPVENCDQVEPKTEAKSPIRKSRRFKRVDDTEETENHENVPAEVTEVPKSKKSKKKKKVEAVIDNPPEEAPAKKSKKKKKKEKRTSSMIVEDVPHNNNSKIGIFNRSTMSVDSFHSAAGSPYKNEKIVTVQDNNVNNIFEITEEINKPSKTNRKNKKNSKNNTLDKKDQSVNMEIDKVDENKNNNKNTKKQKPGFEEIALDQCFVSVVRDNLEDIVNVSHLSNGQLRRRTSNSKHATFDQRNISKNLENDVQSNLNHSNVNKGQMKKRKSNIKEMEVLLPENMSEDVDDDINSHTFDKELRSNSVVQGVTSEKSNASVTNKIVDNNEDVDVSNISNKVLKTRRSMSKNSTFDKSNASLGKEVDNIVNTDLNISNISNQHVHTRRSVVKDSAFDKDNASIVKEIVDNYVDTDLNVSNISNKHFITRRSMVKDSTFDKSNSSITKEIVDVDTDLNVSSISSKRFITRRSMINNSTFDKSNASIANEDPVVEIDLNVSKTHSARKSILKDSTFDKSNASITNVRDTEPELNVSNISNKQLKRRKSNIKDLTFDKQETVLNTTFEKDNNELKRKSPRLPKSPDIQTVLNTTFEKDNNELKRKSPRLSKTPDIQTVLNTTFEKDNSIEGQENLISSSNSSLISSDNSSVMDKSNISRISITSDDTSEHENMVNTTPLLIESSIDESHISITKPESPKPQTPLKREGTFTKDVPEVPIESDLKTPTKRKSVPTAGCTPYHVTKSSQKKTMLNVTRSIEKDVCASVDLAPRLTKVMFCSPVYNPATFTQEKRKIIKSNLKGSNKSFVFDENASKSRPGRKRSYTQNDADDTRVKRTRLTEDLQQSVDRLSRPRTASATAKLSVVTPKKLPIPYKPKSDGKPPRTKLPNFAAMHQKQFDKMESLDECQERRAKRAKQLLTPTAPPGLLERISPKNNIESPKKSKEVAKPKEKTDTPTKKLPTLESLRPGFTRFGFKLNLDVNPFSIPSKTAEKPKEKPVVKPNGIVPRQGILPSLAGTTSVRREVAKLTVMREKSFTDRRNVKRNENRTVIKGVRTNRRFELQMKMRNID